MTPQTNSEPDHASYKANPQHLLKAPPAHPFLSSPSKKDHTQWYMITGGVGLLIVAALVSYFIAGMLFPVVKTYTPDVRPLIIVKPTPVATNTVPDQAVKILTDSVAAETTATDTDDSSEVVDASASTTTVGGGIDENNF